MIEPFGPVPFVLGLVAIVLGIAMYKHATQDPDPEQTRHETRNVERNSRGQT
jgi:hypothetical protein